MTSNDLSELKAAAEAALAANQVAESIFAKSGESLEYYEALDKRDQARLTFCLLAAEPAILSLIARVELDALPSPTPTSEGGE